MFTFQLVLQILFCVSYRWWSNVFFIIKTFVQLITITLGKLCRIFQNLISLLWNINLEVVFIIVNSIWYASFLLMSRVSCIDWDKLFHSPEGQGQTPQGKLITHGCRKMFYFYNQMNFQGRGKTQTHKYFKIWCLQMCQSTM